MTDKIIAAPPVAEEKLVVQDFLGTQREYDLAALRERIVPDGVPDSDVIRFSMMCRMAGANPFIQEAQILPFKDKGQVVGTPYLTAAYYERRAAEHPDFAGMKAWPVDANEKPVPTTTTDPTKVAGAVCEVYRHSWAVPLRVVVAVEEVIRRYAPKQGQPLGDPIGDFWKNPHKRIHQIKKVAIRRALAQAFPAPLGIPEMFEQREHELVEATVDEPTEVDATAGEIIDVDFEEVEAPPEPEAPASPDEQPQVEPPPVIDTETGEVIDVIGEEGATEFKQYVQDNFSGTKEEGQQLSDGLTAWLLTEKVTALRFLPVDRLPYLYAWANEVADIPLPGDPGVCGPPTEPVTLDADATERLIADIRKFGEILGYDDDIISEMIEARADDPGRLRELKQKFSQAEADANETPT